MCQGQLNEEEKGENEREQIGKNKTKGVEEGKTRGQTVSVVPALILLAAQLYSFPEIRLLIPMDSR